MEKASTQVKVAIVGGGPAGCAVALGLARHGLTDVRIVEAGDGRRERVGESVPPDFRRLLSTAGLLDAFLREDHAPCLGSRAAWGQATLGYNDFIVDPHGPGWHLDRARFETFLSAQVEQRGIRIDRATRCRDLRRRDEGGFALQLERNDGASVLQADIVVDAGGLQALLAHRLGARRRVDDQMIVSAVFVDLAARAEQAPRFDAFTLLEAVPEGWWYAARLPDDRAIVAISSDADALRARQLDQAEGWRRALLQTQHLAPLLHDAQWRHARPIRLLAASSELEPCAGRDWLAVGDAASSFDPISAQGLHKAFAQGLAAADAIVGADRGDVGALPAYARLVRDSYARYWQQRQYFYAQETRWPDAPFWQRRQQAALIEG